MLILVVVMSACASRVSYQNIRVKNWNIHRGHNYLEAEFTDFSGNTYHDIRLDKGQEIELTYHADLGKGKIAFQLIDAKDEVIWTSSAKEIGKAYENISIPIPKTGAYKVLIKGEDSTGKFKINWKK